MSQNCTKPESQTHVLRYPFRLLVNLPEYIVSSMKCQESTVSFTRIVLGVIKELG